MAPWGGFKEQKKCPEGNEGKNGAQPDAAAPTEFSPTDENTFKDRIVPRGIAVLKSPIARPSCRPLNHWARAGE